MIDWFTVAAQIINFLILLAVLRYILFGRIVRAYKQRQEKINDSWAEAQKNRKESEELKKDMERQKQELARKKNKLIDEAKAEARQKKEEMLTTAKNELNRKKKEWEREFQRQKKETMKETAGEINRDVFKAASRVLRDLADESLEEQIVRAFLKKASRDKLEKLKEEKKITVGTGFKLSGESRRSLYDFIKEITGEKTEIEFKEDTENPGGLTIQGRRTSVSWSIDSFLRKMEEDMSYKIERELEPAE